MRYVLTARRDEGQAGELAGMLLEAAPGDEIIVETVTLKASADHVIAAHDIQGVTVVINAEAVAETRGAAPMKRMTGPHRHSPRIFMVPEQVPGMRTFTPAQPTHVHHPVSKDETDLPSGE